MSTTPLDRAESGEVIYPDSDGQPMADNTLRYRWIVTLQGNIDLLFVDDPNVFVAGDLLWYPVKGQPALRTAPDVLVAVGRPKGYRGSYRQWEEAGVAPQIVFEVLSPGNRMREMALKLDFYERYGVEEYYIYNPDTFDFSAWMREGDRLHVADTVNGWISPLLGIRFEIPERGEFDLPERSEMRVFYPDGSPFLAMLELGQARKAAEEAREAAEQRTARMAARLRELGVDPDAV